jgi:DNA topoisomerase-2
MHAFNSKCVIHKYETLNEILEEFAGVRLDLYHKRRAFLLNEMNEKLPYHENVVRFIEQQNQDNPIPDLRRKTREECDHLLEKNKFSKLPSYDYLMDLPIKSITSTFAQKHRDDLDKLKKSIYNLENTTAQEMWLSDLETFSKNYSKVK